MSERIETAALRDFFRFAQPRGGAFGGRCRAFDRQYSLCRMPGRHVARTAASAAVHCPAPLGRDGKQCSDAVHDGIRRHGAARRAERSRPARRAEGLRQGGGARRKIRRFVRSGGKLQPFRHGRMVRHPRAARLFRFQHFLGGQRHGAARRGAAASRHRPGRAGTAARRGKAPLALDMALSTAARGKIRYAALNGTPIPETWGWTRTARPRPTPPPCSTAARSFLPAAQRGRGLRSSLSFSAPCSRAVALSAARGFSDSRARRERGTSSAAWI